MTMTEILRSVKRASVDLHSLSEEKINSVLMALADETEKNVDFLLRENLKDLNLMDKANPMYDRLMLNAERIKNIAYDLRNLAGLPSPLNRLLSENTLSNGLKISKISVAFGVIGIIYESRPNVSFDVFSLCFKSGNACILKGGSDAYNSNSAIISLIHNVLNKFDINPDVVTLLPAGREYLGELLVARDFVDLIIPRGSKDLINYVRDNAKVPVIETGAGVCHTYIDFSADTKMASEIVFNAKTRRVSVCNALDCVIINRQRLNDLPQILSPLATKNVIIYADEDSYNVLKGHYPDNLLCQASSQHFGLEFQDYKMAVKTVNDIVEAVQHISRYSSKHSEAIVSASPENIDYFDKNVDAACVYTNAPTSFTDGAQFGFGAEIGISTQKMHARGPMALNEMTTYKWIIKGEGQIRN